jgi:hypothetical protein
MIDTIIVALLGGLFLILSNLFSFVIGQRSERKKQSLIKRAELLIPIDDWLHGAGRMVGIYGDTLNSVLLDSPEPMVYSLEERRRSSQFMSENSNQLLGILVSKSLQTKDTKKLSDQLSLLIINIMVKLKNELLPYDIEIMERAKEIKQKGELLVKVTKTKEELDRMIQQSYSLISQIRIKLI